MKWASGRARPARTSSSFLEHSRLPSLAQPLRLLVFDSTQRQRPPRALGWSWHAGSYLYRGLGRIDAAHGATSWADALRFLTTHAPDRPIAELQFWGHGKWGRALIGNESLDRRALRAGHGLYAELRGFTERLSERALIWFRTCETLGAEPGHDFARALGDFTGAHVAGHTFVIGYFQSGLHRLAPGTAPQWSTEEGLSRGTPSGPERAFRSSPLRPNTITCLDGEIPTDY